MTTPPPPRPALPALIAPAPHRLTPAPRRPCSALRAGESYEICLTTALTRQGSPPPAALYSALRAINPAPYAAWLHMGPAGGLWQF